MIQHVYLMLIKNSFKVNAFALLCFLNFTCMNASGFDGNTLVTTSSGRLKSIKELQVGDEVVSYNNNLEPEINPIKGVCAFMVDATMNITTQDNISMTTGLMERFYLPIENQWVCAKDLKKGDCLLNEDLEYIAITNVEMHEGKSIMFLISVDNQHNFLASQGKYLTHNGPIGAAIGVFVGASAVAGAYGGLTCLVGVLSGPAAPVVVPIWCLWTAGPATVATKVGGLAGGLIVGVATGPV
ncbi:Hint domain-containing protein [Candidatus Chromulinivorax destructor]|uniref:Hint domain-containing protein n=1 Tax=Candidatus Chromulinivorax destructor TaxID=2066483 RepID=A0A345ZCY9_9BACT|nr:Hint domain-containing protein [Candidatus Chromulinivorax destructor]AXK61156.1 hypothetical protein C0J27_05500 [Candidatus Chromulinivorax destructor]